MNDFTPPYIYEGLMAEEDAAALSRKPMQRQVGGFLIPEGEGEGEPSVTLPTLPQHYNAEAATAYMKARMQQSLERFGRLTHVAQLHYVPPRNRPRSIWHGFLMGALQAGAAMIEPMIPRR